MWLSFFLSRIEINVFAILIASSLVTDILVTDIAGVIQCFFRHPIVFRYRVKHCFKLVYTRSVLNELIAAIRASRKHIWLLVDYIHLFHTRKLFCFEFSRDQLTTSHLNFY